MPDVLEQLHQEIGFDSIWAHEETLTKSATSAIAVYDLERNPAGTAERDSTEEHLGIMLPMIGSPFREGVDDQVLCILLPPRLGAATSGA